MPPCRQTWACARYTVTVLLICFKGGKYRGSTAELVLEPHLLAIRQEAGGGGIVQGRQDPGQEGQRSHDGAVQGGAPDIEVVVAEGHPVGVHNTVQAAVGADTGQAGVIG